MKRVLLALVLLALPVLVQAQTVEGYRLNVYPGTGATTPVTFIEYAISTVACNQAPTTNLPQTPVNPTKAQWDDPNNAGKVCVYTDPGGGPLLGLPPTGTFEASLQAYNAAGRSVESNRAPFTRLAAPSAVAGFRLIRP